MRARLAALVAAVSLLTLGLPVAASASCTQTEFGCAEDLVCAAVNAVKPVDCGEWTSGDVAGAAPAGGGLGSFSSDRRAGGDAGLGATQG